MIRLNRSESKKTRRAARTDTRTRFYDAIADVPHGVYYQDGEQIFIANGAEWNIYVFRRTNDREPDGGQWVNTGITTSGVALW